MRNFARFFLSSFSFPGSLPFPRFLPFRDFFRQRLKLVAEGHSEARRLALFFFFSISLPAFPFGEHQSSLDLTGGYPLSQHRESPLPPPFLLGLSPLGFFRPRWPRRRSRFRSPPPRSPLMAFFFPFSFLFLFLLSGFFLFLFARLRQGPVECVQKGELFRPERIILPSLPPFFFVLSSGSLYFLFSLGLMLWRRHESDKNKPALGARSPIPFSFFFFPPSFLSFLFSFPAGRCEEEEGEDGNGAT